MPEPPMGSPGIVLTALRWWLEAQVLPPQIRRFRRRAIALALRSRDLRAIRYTVPTGQLKILLDLTERRPRIVEIGTGWGWTAATLVLAHPGCAVETYDPAAPRLRSAYLDLLPEQARARIELVQARGEDARPPDRPVDALFVDDAHDAGEIVAAVSRWLPALAADAVVVFDDFGEEYYPGVRAAVAELGLSGYAHGRFFVAEI
ncbi:MAG: class I SAM-dependent methyltransferase [Thermoleophilia bacterium]